LIDFVQFITPAYVTSFFLLFIRFSAIFTFMPFYGHQSVPIPVKAALAFYLTLLFFPQVKNIQMEVELLWLVGAILGEMILGLFAGLILQIVIAVLMFAGEQMAFIMGFTLANTMDPVTNTQVPILSGFFNFLALMILLALNAHHLILEFISHSLIEIPPGFIVFSHDVLDYIIKAMAHFFVIGFSISFPIIALSLLADIIFGMLMKTMPQFNLLVIGFPIKIAVSFTVLVAILTAIMHNFKREFMEAFNALQLLF